MQYGNLAFCYFLWYLAEIFRQSNFFSKGMCIFFKHLFGPPLDLGTWNVCTTAMLCLQAGSVHVRIRRDADEQMVLSHVYHRLSNLLSVLTIQVFKDDWSRPSTYQILGDSSLLSKMRPGSTPPKMASHSHGPGGAAHSHSHNSGITHNVTPELFAAPAYDTQRVSPRTIDPLVKSSAFTSANLVTPPVGGAHSHLGSGPVGGASQHAVELDSSKNHGHSHNHHGHSHWQHWGSYAVKYY